MKNIMLLKVFLLLFTLSVILSISFLKSQEIKTEEGVPVVYNPKEPTPPPGAKTSLILEEELCIGCNEKGDFFSPQPRYISTAIDKDLNIFIALNGTKAEIRKYRADGHLIKTFGKKGEPGELKFPSGLMISPQDELVVHDPANGTLNFYSLDGEFLRRVFKYSLGLNKFMFDSNGNIVADKRNLSQMFEKERKATLEIRRFNQKLEPLSTIFSLDITEDIKDRTKGQRNIGPNYYWQLTKDDHIIIGDTKKYEFLVINSEGQIIKKIKKGYDPLPVLKEDYDYLPEVQREWFGIAKQHTGFYFFTIDYDGRIFARTWEKTKDKRGYYYNVFDPEGRYIAKIPIKAFIKRWMKGKMLAAEKTEDGSTVIKRYKVAWK